LVLSGKSSCQNCRNWNLGGTDLAKDFLENLLPWYQWAHLVIAIASADDDFVTYQARWPNNRERQRDPIPN
jgi:hypothetical protein